MSISLKVESTIRKSFRSLPIAGGMPSTKKINKEDYDAFLQRFTANSNRKAFGLQKTLSDMFPISFTESFNPNGKDTKSGAKGNYISAYFIRYFLGKPKYSVDQCKEYRLDFSSPLIIELKFLRNTLKNIPNQIQNVEEVDLYERTELDRIYLNLGSIPLMTENGVFVLNGIEKTIVSQLHRPDSLCLFMDESNRFSNSDHYRGLRIIPNIGKPIHIGINAKQDLTVKIGQHEHDLHLPLFCRMLSIKKDVLIKAFFPILKFKPILKSNDDTGNQHWFNITPINSQRLSLSSFTDYLENKLQPNGAHQASKNKYDQSSLFGLDTATLCNVSFKNPVIKTYDIIGNYLFAQKVIHPITGKVIIPSGKIVTTKHMEVIKLLGINQINILDINYFNKCYTWEKKLWKRINQQYHLTTEYLNEVASIFTDNYLDGVRVKGRYLEDFKKKMTHPDFFQFSSLIRDEIQSLFDCTDVSLNGTLMSHLIRVLSLTLNFKGPSFEQDMLKHTMSRNFRYPLCPTHLIEESIKNGLTKIRTTAFFRYKQMSNLSKNPLTRKRQLTALFKTSPLDTSIKELFNSSSLGQMLDNTNSLAEETHKRRMTFLGPGGLTIGTSTLKDRDIDLDYYGKLCPIETPEGKNVGLVGSPGSYFRKDSNSLIQIPFIKIVKGKLTNSVYYISQQEEKQYVIAFASEMPKFFTLELDNSILCRFRGNFVEESILSVQYIELSTKQIISLSSSLIPFLEHDDASRALMGSNMQRQAVPIEGSCPPLVGTGSERYISANSRNGKTSHFQMNVLAGESIWSRTYVPIYSMSEQPSKYGLTKNKPFGSIKNSGISRIHPSNQKTSIYYKKSCINEGQFFARSNLISHSNSTKGEEISLGKDLLVAFMSFNGQSFEDSIVVSDRVSKESLLTSIHTKVIEESVQNSPQEFETFKCSIPEQDKHTLTHLDRDGIAKVGSHLKPGDVVIGKIKTTRDSNTAKKMNSSNSLVSLVNSSMLKQIFKDEHPKSKYQDTDTSTVMKTGEKGKVIDVIKTFQARTSFFENTISSLDNINTIDLIYYFRTKIIFLENLKYKYLLYLNQRNISEGSLASSTLLQQIKIDFKNPKCFSTGLENYKFLNDQIDTIRKMYLTYISTLLKNKTSSSLQSVRVILHKYSFLKAGDKLTGRHGNKGVVCKIMKEEDMPYTIDGRSIDVVLNPMGISSRMNLGQVYETNMGWWSEILGKKISNLNGTSIKKGSLSYRNCKSFIKSLFEGNSQPFSFGRKSTKGLVELYEQYNKGIPVQTDAFKSVSDEEIEKYYRKTNLIPTSQITLYDGQTGESFDRRVTVGNMYMLKLNHLVEEKIHARTTGPYHLITQQPLGGKSKRGGQRLGEMEVWALQGYGSAHNLQEMLTVKSDSLRGRFALSRKIANEDQDSHIGIPEAFHVLLKELQSLGLHLTIKDKKNN